MGKRGDNPSSMWAEACAMLERAERLQREFFQPPGPARSASWEPPVDLFELDGALRVVVALPGVAPSQLELLFDGADLVVRGERALPVESAGWAIRRLEIPIGRLERRIALPPGRFELAERRLADGCLSVLLRQC